MASFLFLPGTPGNYASSLDSPAVSVVGDLDLRMLAALDDWTPAVKATAIAKDVNNPNRSYLLTVQGNDAFRFDHSETGTGIKASGSTGALGIADGAKQWIRSTLKANNGASGHDKEFFLGGADDTPVWVQQGSTRTTAGTTSIFDGTAPVEIGSFINGTTQLLVGKVYRAIILAGIDGTVVFDPRFDLQPAGTTSFVESSSEGATVTINQSGDPQAEIVGDAAQLPTSPHHFRAGFDRVHGGFAT